MGERSSLPLEGKVSAVRLTDEVPSQSSLPSCSPIVITADWWCPKDRLHKTKQLLADEICTIAASHIAFDVTEDQDGRGCVVRAELRICGEAYHHAEA